MAPVPLGIYGRFYSVRNALGQYRSAAVTGEYTISPPPDQPKDWVQTTLESSLQATVRQHPGLCYGLAGQPGEDSIVGYEAINTIHRDDVMEFFHVDSPQEAEAIMRQKLEAAHTKRWTPPKPAWRMIVVHSEASAEPASSKIYVIFICHHAIADGRSDAAFHVSLMKHFAHASNINESPTWPMVFDKAPPPPLQIEDVVDLPTPTTEAAGGSSQERVWDGTYTTEPSIDEYKSRVRLVTIPPNSLSKALQICKQNDITLTVYLHGLFCASLCNILKDEWAFRSITPYSVRHLTKAGVDEIVDHVSYVICHASKAKLEGIRKSSPRSPEEFAHVLNLAREFRAVITDEVQRFPQDSPLARTAQVKDVWSHCRRQLGKRSELSYEWSNLGAISGAAEGQGNLTLDRLIFTQCGMVNGPAMGFGGVSVRGGPLVISITWQEGVVDESFVESMATELESRLGNGAD